MEWLVKPQVSTADRFLWRERGGVLRRLALSETALSKELKSFLAILGFCVVIFRRFILKKRKLFFVEFSLSKSMKSFAF